MGDKRFGIFPGVLQHLEQQTVETALSLFGDLDPLMLLDPIAENSLARLLHKSHMARLERICQHCMNWPLGRRRHL